MSRILVSYIIGISWNCQLH